MPLRSALALVPLIVVVTFVEEMRVAAPSHINAQPAGKSRPPVEGGRDLWSMNLNRDLRFFFDSADGEHGPIWFIRDRLHPDKMWITEKTTAHRTDRSYALITRIIDPDRGRAAASGPWRSLSESSKPSTRGRDRWWRSIPALAPVRTELAEFLEAEGGIALTGELAQFLLTSRRSDATEPQHLPMGQYSRD
jgi:hypothetical protein